MRERGIVKWYNSASGFGFLTDANGGDVFLHVQTCKAAGLTALRPGIPLDFEREESPSNANQERRWRAKCVSIVTEDAELVTELLRRSLELRKTNGEAERYDAKLMHAAAEAITSRVESRG